MAMNLLSIEPHKVSRDLSGYITYIYGAPKTGKTTLATQMPNHLLLAFEKGYNALPGIMAQDITTWGEFKQVVRELKKPEVQERYKSLIIDTVDIASDLCQKYICNQLGIENIGDGGWSTNGWSKYKKEFEETFRSLTMMGYAVVFISHEKDKVITPKDGGKEYTQTVPAVQTSALNIIENMADIYGYAHSKQTENGSKVVLTLRSSDNSVRCGGRFKYIAPEIDFNYKSLEKAVIDAIEQEAAETDGQFVTTEREVASILPTYDFDSMMAEFQELVGILMTKNQSNSPKITSIVEQYLGTGKKVSDCTPRQCEQIACILTELKELL